MSKKKSNEKSKIIIIVLIAIITAIVGILLYQNNKKKYEYTLQEINESDVKYYLLEKDDKYGVIDKDGNVVIEPTYVSMSIPNPTTDIFICTESNSTDANYKVVNSQNKQILTQYADIESISIKSIMGLVPYEKTVLKYKENGYYGIIDLTGKKITQAIYEEIKSIDYKEGCLQVKKDGKYGVINIKGTSLIKAEYDNITADGYYNKTTKYAEAGFIIRQKTDEGYRFGYADKNGKIILEPIYNEVNRITEIEDTKTVYLIPSTNGRYGLVKNGKQIIENEYDDLTYDKTNNIIIIEKNNAKGVVDMDGKTLIPIDYEEITIGGSHIAAIKGENTVIFDNKGNKIDTDITSYLQVSNDYSIIIDKDNNYNIIDKSGNKLLHEDYIYIEYFINNYFIVVKDGKSGIINADGNVIVPISYSTIQKIADTDLLEATDSKEKRIDIITKNAEVSKGIANSSISIEKNYIKICSVNDVRYFNLDGKETTYKELFPNNKIYAQKKGEKWGFIDASGKEITEYKYDMVSEQNGNTAGIKINGKWGIIDTTGKVLVEPEYNISWNNAEFLGNYYAITDNVGIAIYCGDKQSL